MKKRVLYTKPSITESEIEYVIDAARSGWGERCYDYISLFEELFRDQFKVKFAIATSSCTGALHMGLAALGVEPGDEIILADSNWIATVAPIVHLGAKPVLVDILEDSWCIDPILAEKAITSRTKAIIATHLYGNLCDMQRLLEIGQKYGIAIIEDAAEAIGSIYHGAPAGSIGTFGTFSFHGSKTITTGEGGMFVTNDESLYDTVLTLSNHGRSSKQSKQFWPELFGFKYKISNLQAAIGCGQIKRVKELVKRKRDIFQYYKNIIMDYSFIKTNIEPPNTQNGFWMPTLVFDATSRITREQLQRAFSEDNIDARVFFYPLSSLPMFNTITCRNPIAQNTASRGINLPSYHDISDTSLNRVREVIKKVISCESF